MTAIRLLAGLILGCGLVGGVFAAPVDELSDLAAPGWRVWRCDGVRGAVIYQGTPCAGDGSRLFAGVREVNAWEWHRPRVGLSSSGPVVRESVEVQALRRTTVGELLELRARAGAQ